MRDLSKKILRSHKNTHVESFRSPPRSSPSDHWFGSQQGGNIYTPTAPRGLTVRLSSRCSHFRRVLLSCFVGRTLRSSAYLSPRLSGCLPLTPVTCSTKDECLEWINSMRETNASFVSCKRLGRLFHASNISILNFFCSHVTTVTVSSWSVAHPLCPCVCVCMTAVGRAALALSGAVRGRHPVVVAVPQRGAAAAARRALLRVPLLRHGRRQ